MCPEDEFRSFLNVLFSPPRENFKWIWYAIFLLSRLKPNNNEEYLLYCWWEMNLLHFLLPYVYITYCILLLYHYFFFTLSLYLITLFKKNKVCAIVACSNKCIHHCLLTSLFCYRRRAAAPPRRHVRTLLDLSYARHSRTFKRIVVASHIIHILDSYSYI